MNIILNAPALPFSVLQWNTILRSMLGIVDRSSAQINLYLERDGRMAELNHDFMSYPGPTNVLSFLAGRTDYLGEICISYDALRREAILYGQSLKEQAVFLLAHGLAHLLGYDHGQEMDNICALMIKNVPETELL